MLKQFKINSKRDLLAPDFACYQMDLKGPVNAAIEAGEVDEDFKLLPSWAKFGSNPAKAKGFFVRTLEAVFLGKGNHDELNVDYQLEGSPEQRVAMMFISAKNNKALNESAKIAQQTLPGYEVIVLNGTQTYNGRKVTNKSAEPIVKEIVESGKPVLIMSKDMAARSFSIPEITELYLAYDRGSEGTTIQKMSRTLTPGEENKVGRIFSLSFDPNRDDKFDAMVIETALNYKRRHNTNSLQEAMRNVLRTIDIFTCTQDGAVKMDIDTYLENALARKGISRVLGKIVNLSLLTPEAIAALANGNSDYFRAAMQEAAESGKTTDTPSSKGESNSEPTDNSVAKEFAKAREVITTIIENLDIIILGTGSKILADAMFEIEASSEMKECVQEEFGVDTETISYLFKNNIVKQEWVELLYDNS